MMAEFLEGTPPAGPPPPSGMCERCGADVPAVWLGFLKSRAEWHTPRICGRCSVARDRQRTEELRERRRREWLDGTFERAGLTPEMRAKTFEGFERVAGTEEALAACQGFARIVVLGGSGSRPAYPKRGLLLVGGNGSGKSHLATATVNEVLRQAPQRVARFLRLMDWVAALRRAYEGAPGAAEELREALFGCELVVLDDIGAPAIRSGDSGDWVREELHRALDGLIEGERAVVVTADRTEQELAAKVGAAVMSRLHEACRVVVLTAPDYRRRSAGRGDQRQTPKGEGEVA